MHVTPFPREHATTAGQYCTHAVIIPSDSTINLRHSKLFIGYSYFKNFKQMSSKSVQVTSTPASQPLEPLYPRFTDVSPYSGDKFGTDYGLVLTELPQMLPRTCTSIFTGTGVVGTPSDTPTAGPETLHLSILSYTSTFYRSAFYYQAVLGEC